MRWVGKALTRRKGVGVFGSALLRHEGVRGFGFGIGCSGVIQMTRDGRRQVRIGQIGVGMVTVVTVTYHLSIPSKWKIHNTSHASLLSPYRENDVHGPNYMRPPPDLIRTEEEYEVEAIITHQGSTRNRSYLVHWKGYSSAEDSWEPEANLEHAADLLRAYKRAHPKAFSPRTRTISVNCIYSDMSPIRTVPYARRLHEPACPGTLSTHISNLASFLTV